MAIPYYVGLYVLDSDEDEEVINPSTPPVYEPIDTGWDEPSYYPSYYPEDTIPELPMITKPDYVPSDSPQSEYTEPDTPLSPPSYYPEYTAPEYAIPKLPMITKPDYVPPYSLPTGEPYASTGQPLYPQPEYKIPIDTPEYWTEERMLDILRIEAEGRREAAARRAAAQGGPSGRPSGRPSGGPSGGPSGEDADIDILGDLQWWANAASIQPLLRPWAGWLRELIEGNKTRAVPNPFIEDVEAEALKTELPEGATSVAGFASNQELMGRLKGLLGLEFGEEETPTSQWQKVITAIPGASLEAQQLMSSLRFDPNVGSWYAVDIDQLVNPKYL